MKTSKFNKVMKVLLKPFAYFILNLLDGYGWRAFLSRLCVVVIFLKLNPYDSAVHQFTTGAMKFFLFTCVILVYAIYKLIFDYTKRGVELERKRQNKSEGHSE